MTRSASEVFNLMPAVYRERDARLDGEPGFLQDLLTVIAGQMAVIDADIDELYDDLFIETCSAWVVPYIGDLVAVTPGAPDADDTVLTRAAVADAIALRRRKGTIAVLEQLARDLTGWPAVAAEMFQRLAFAQHLQHLDPRRGLTVSLRSALRLERINTAFDSSAHSLEVRRIGSGRGLYDVENVAIFLWRDQLIPHTMVDARRVDATGVDGRRFRFSPLGLDQQLITKPKTELALMDKATSLNAPIPISRRAMSADPAAYYGNSLVVQLTGGQEPVDQADIIVCDLADTAPDGANWSNVSRLAHGQVGIDPALGRLAFGTPQPTPPQVSYLTAEPSDVGGSEDGHRPATPAGLAVTQVRRDSSGPESPDVAAALAAVGDTGTIEITDSRTYFGDLTATVPTGEKLRVVSLGGATPLISLRTGWSVTVGEGAVIALAGLIVEGGALTVRGRPERVEIDDCTFVPGRRCSADAQASVPIGPSIILDLDTDWETTVLVTNCVTGPLVIPADGTKLIITDSIVDGVADGLGRSAASGSPARVIPTLCSPHPLTGVVLPPGSSTLGLLLGTDPLRVIDIGVTPADAVSAAAALDLALAGSGSRACAIADRVVMIGDGRPLAAIGQPGSGLADGLGLTGPAANTRAVLGGPTDVAAAAGGGKLTIIDRRGTSYSAELGAGTADLDLLAERVQSAVRNADAAFSGVLVGVLNNALIVVPPPASPAAALTLTGTPTDSNTAWNLGLVSPQPAIAAAPAGGPGAALSLTRCTVFGAIDVVEIDQVNDSIITGLLTSERRQIGCVQYSWIAPGSSTARQHQCQPASSTTPPPLFVSRDFGRTGYGRLRRAGATALIRGAGNGFEMGAMARLRQTQRDDNLRRGVEEFLRFGLEAGVLDGT